MERTFPSYPSRSSAIQSNLFPLLLFSSTFPPIVDGAFWLPRGGIPPPALSSAPGSQSGWPLDPNLRLLLDPLVLSLHLPGTALPPPRVPKITWQLSRRGRKEMNETRGKKRGIGKSPFKGQHKGSLQGKSLMGKGKGRKKMPPPFPPSSSSTDSLCYNFFPVCGQKEGKRRTELLLPPLFLLLHSGGMKSAGVNCSPPRLRFSEIAQETRLVRNYSPHFRSFLFGQRRGGNAVRPISKWSRVRSWGEGERRRRTAKTFFPVVVTRAVAATDGGAGFRGKTKKVRAQSRKEVGIQTLGKKRFVRPTVTCVISKCPHKLPP